MNFYRDEDFLRARRADGRIVPMSKFEIRVLDMAYLELREGLEVLDIGAGTGSLTCEAARLVKSGRVVAIERETLAARAIVKNSELLGLKNVEVIDKSFSSALEKLTHTNFDRIIIGGSGGELKEILEYSLTHLSHGGIIVANFITIENVSEMLEFLREVDFETKLIEVSVARGREIASKTMLIAQNPVFIVSAREKTCSSYAD